MSVKIKPLWLFLITLAAIGPVAVAWGQYFTLGLPQITESPQTIPAIVNDPIGFPIWIRLTHFVNFFLMVLLVRSGLSILMDHPRLYLNDHCTPGSAWLRFTPIDVPKDRIWTAKDDSRYLSPIIGLPGYRHTVGIARYWHFLSAFFWVINGLIFIALLFCTNQWKRLVPIDTKIFFDAWNVFVHYATLHLPVEPDGFYKYNPLQQLSYFGVIFLLAPTTFFTGLAMSPAIDNRFRWYPKLFGGRQCARSIHFLALLGYLGFLVPHLTMVALTGLKQNLNHIVFGTDDQNPLGLIIGAIGIFLVVLACFGAHWISWNRPRALQMGFRKLLGPLQRRFLNQMETRAEYSKAEISPYFWPNGKMPNDPAWLALQSEGFKNYRLKVFGLVENPVELSLDDIIALGKQDQITMHHCIQGWSGIAHWGGLSLERLIQHVRPLHGAGTVVFHSFGEGHYGGEYYDSLSIKNALHHQTMLAFEMNFERLNVVHGAPLRLRAENQLGYKMVKWIRAVEFVKDETSVGKGYGGKNEDDEFYPMVANI
ncbi:MAG: hypothetical protein EXR99_15335 [Gemmataceae bacterium]|nr:hypothetical protein [Gemmataceae bacterium]